MSSLPSGALSRASAPADITHTHALHESTPAHGHTEEALLHTSPQLSISLSSDHPPPAPPEVGPRAEPLQAEQDEYPDAPLVGTLPVSTADGVEAPPPSVAQFASPASAPLGPPVVPALTPVDDSSGWPLLDREIYEAAWLSHGRTKKSTARARCRAAFALAQQIWSCGDVAVRSALSQHGPKLCSALTEEVLRDLFKREDVRGASDPKADEHHDTRGNAVNQVNQLARVVLEYHLCNGKMDVHAHLEAGKSHKRVGQDHQQESTADEPSGPDEQHSPVAHSTPENEPEATPAVRRSVRDRHPTKRHDGEPVTILEPAVSTDADSSSSDAAAESDGRDSPVTPQVQGTLSPKRHTQPTPKTAGAATVSSPPKARRANTAPQAQLAALRNGSGDGVVILADASPQRRLPALRHEQRTVDSARRSLAAVTGDATATARDRNSAELTAFILDELEKSARMVDHQRVELQSLRAKRQEDTTQIAALRSELDALKRQVAQLARGVLTCDPAPPVTENALSFSVHQVKGDGRCLFSAVETVLGWGASKAKVLISNTVHEAGWEAFRKWGLILPERRNGRRWSKDPSPEEKREQIKRYVDELAEQSYHGGMEELRVLRDCEALQGKVRFIVLKTHGPDAAITEGQWFETSDAAIGSGPRESKDFPTNEVLLHFHAPMRSATGTAVTEGHFDAVCYKSSSAASANAPEFMLSEPSVEILPDVPPGGTDRMKQALRACQDWRRGRARPAQQPPQKPTTFSAVVQKSKQTAAQVSSASAQPSPSPSPAPSPTRGASQADKGSPDGFRISAAASKKARRNERRQPEPENRDEPAHGVVIWSVPTDLVEKDCEDLSAVRDQAHAEGITIPNSARMYALKNQPTDSRPVSYRVVVHLKSDQDVLTMLNQQASARRLLSWHIQRHRPWAERPARGRKPKAKQSEQ